MSKFPVFFCIVACAILFSASLVFSQSDDNGITEVQNGQSGITTRDDSVIAASDQLPQPLKSDAVSALDADDGQGNSDSKEIKSARPKSELLAEGKAKKATGAALTGVGGFFMGGALVYTALFAVDNRTFGIYLGSSSSGYYVTDYYLNPGIFAIPIGAPCLALGIVNLIKGKNMINDAMSGDDEDNSAAPFKMVPYVSYQPKVKGYGAGLIATF